jgi:hypothetical protein
MGRVVGESDGLRVGGGVLGLAVGENDCVGLNDGEYDGAADWVGEADGAEDIVAKT